MPARSAATRHRTAQGVDFPDQMPLTDTANGRVAAHLPQRLDALRQQQGARTHPRGRQRRLGAGMAAADDDDVKGSGEAHR